jgi:hypothetical protein
MKRRRFLFLTRYTNNNAHLSYPFSLHFLVWVAFKFCILEQNYMWLVLPYFEETGPEKSRGI